MDRDDLLRRTLFEAHTEIAEAEALSEDIAIKGLSMEDFGPAGAEFAEALTQLRAHLASQPQTRPGFRPLLERMMPALRLATQRLREAHEHRYSAERTR